MLSATEIKGCTSKKSLKKFFALLFQKLEVWGYEKKFCVFVPKTLPRQHQLQIYKIRVQSLQDEIELLVNI